jgi:uncharacterized protein
MKREENLKQIQQHFLVNSMVAILGPRQCGKTTLAHMFANQYNGNVTHFDLEDPLQLAQLENPTLTLEPLSGLIIIDEIQRKPNLFTTLRVLIDKHRKRQNYLILGSASRELIRQSSETLAGRISYLKLTPFDLNEVKNAKKLWLRGGFPSSYLANTLSISGLWRKSYIKTFLEQDIPNLGIKVPAQTLRRFWMMLLSYHANIFNASEIARSLGLSNTAIRHYVNILTGTFMIRQLMPWYENITKRQVKSPKIYFRDSGILHSLMGINDQEALRNSAKLGASWEGFALEEVIRHCKVDPEDCYFWATHSGAELDLLITKNMQKIGFEFKFTEQPKITKSMQIALNELNLDQLIVVIPKSCDFLLSKNIRVLGLEDFIKNFHF